jgi:hypothetical protein
MWQRCKRPNDQRIHFNLSGNLKLFKNTVYAAYIPGSSIIVVAGTEYRALRRPKGSDDCDELDWKALSQYIEKQKLPLNWEWWRAENPQRLPRYRRASTEIPMCTTQGLEPMAYTKLPLLVQKFWRNTTARLFGLVDELPLNQVESANIARYAKQWTPPSWFPAYCEANEAYDVAFPPSNLFKTLHASATVYQTTRLLPVEFGSLKKINMYATLLAARLAKRYTFIDVPINGLLTYVFVDKIVENAWNAVSGDVELDYSDVHAALAHWLEENMHFNFVLDCNPMMPRRNVYLPNVLQKMNLPCSRVGEVPVLEKDCQFLEIENYVDFNYTEMPNNFILKPRLLRVPLFPRVRKSERICAFLYSILQSEYFVQCFCEYVYLPSTIMVGGRHYVLSLLVNAIPEKIIDFLQ